MEEKLELIAETLDVEAIAADAVLADMEEWNSMNKLSIIVMIDDECGKKVTSEDIKGFKTVQDIIDFME
ncbi:acyl carrier protein [Adlercreutzia sp. ZJ473]|uniref:acyl carrier protein n=1 Tax=Adlercreutzia sp. ZJ473 TaxID=2722822 RepID=UPI001555FE09|nr:phosphopantetheine-binding protein [Adlercreutzia sp. ZJ473]